MKCKNIECKNEVKKGRVYCSFKCRNIYVNTHLRDYSKNGKGLRESYGVESEYLKNPKKCKECGLNLPYEKRNNLFCNHSCSASYTNKHRDSIWTSDRRDNLSYKIKKLWEAGFYDETTALNHLTHTKIFSSKNEREIYKYFKSNFSKDEWLSGGQLKHNGFRISRDMYSNKLKICFEYDGIWHFKDIKGQLSRKLKVDMALEDWCKLNKYRLIRIDEERYTDVSLIVDLIYNKSDEIIKVGNRYKKI
jgi:hypothetical protein